jgi:2,4-dienoyl-CoA reductase-like NADH-dependent reductase (Old Yellow Enzyme family)
MMKIFEPIKLKNVLFQNRAVMAPMVPFGMPERTDGVMSDTLLRHYLDRAANGMGLMITQSLSVTSKLPAAGGTGIYADDHIDHLRSIAAACHEQNTKLFVQLAYPSAGHQNGDSVNGLTADEIAEIKEEFVRAAFRCREAGCDGVELHGAHGYFLNMFASPLANQRTDSNGGDLDGRLHLVRNIVDGIRTFLDDDFIVSYRMGLNDNMEMDIQTARVLEALGVELLHVSSGISEGRHTAIPEDFPYNSIVFSGTELRRHVNIPVVVVNDIRTLDRGNALLEDGLCDFAAFGKPFLADPLFYKNSIGKMDHQPCFRCKKCLWFTHYDRCPAYRMGNKMIQI